jgi:hypothetical protein
MKKRQKDRLLKKRRYHNQSQKAKRGAALEAALSSDEPVVEMKERGYIADDKGGWRKIFPVHRKQPRKPQ